METTRQQDIEGATFQITSILPENIAWKDILLKAAVEEATRSLVFA